MSRRLSIVLALLGLALASSARADVQPGTPPFGAFAETSLKVSRHQAYLVSFTVVREVTAATTRLELISSTNLCDTDTLHCEQVAEQTDALPMSSLTVSASGRAATLRTRWVGAPLLITWTGHGSPASGQLLIVGSADGMHHQLWADGYTMTDAVTSTRLFGRSCRDVGHLYAAEAGAAEDYEVSGPSKVGRADRLRAKLAATKGRCFNPY